MYNWQKTLFLIRGLPGSGKSTLALSLVGNIQQVVENDDYWLTPDKNGILTYQYVASQTHLAGQWCGAEAFRRLHIYDEIAVANTFIQRKYILQYIEEAYRVKVRVRLHEPETEWAKDVEQCNLKNIHSVPPEVIARMKLQWEEITQEQIDAMLGLT